MYGSKAKRGGQEWRPTPHSVYWAAWRGVDGGDGENELSEIRFGFWFQAPTEQRENANFLRIKALETYRKMGYGSRPAPELKLDGPVACLGPRSEWRVPGWCGTQNLRAVWLMAAEEEGEEDSDSVAEAEATTPFTLTWRSGWMENAR